MNILQQFLVSLAEFLITFWNFTGIAGIIGSQIDYDQIRGEFARIPFLPFFLWFPEVLLAAAGIGIFIEHRYQPGLIWCLHVVANIAGKHSLAVPCHDLQISI